MKNLSKAIIITVIITCFPVFIVNAQENKEEVDDQTLLELYQGLRVADVSDGMDMVGLRDQGLMNQKIQALWKDIEDFKHTFCGIAVTARYIPTNKVIKNPMSKEEFQQWEGEWYNEKSPEPFVEFLKSGSVVVIDVNGDGDTGSVGSYNGLSWISKGARGIISNGGVRDTDELIKQEVPVYFDPDNRGRGIRPGRNEIESVNETISLGGVQVNPGDVIVADGDGVIVVPRKHAVEVAEYASEILESDKNARRNLYEEMDKPLDETVK
ncbi:MAG: RraA family protein [Bacteroidota bacterium]